CSCKLEISPGSIIEKKEFPARISHKLPEVECPSFLSLLQIVKYQRSGRSGSLHSLADRIRMHAELFIEESGRVLCVLYPPVDKGDQGRDIKQDSFMDRRIAKPLRKKKFPWRSAGGFGKKRLFRLELGCPEVSC